VAEALAGFVDVETMEPPATLDGGDVLQVGGSVYVGVSLRTNPAGVEALRRFAAGRPVFPIEVRAGLHLKSAVSAITPDTVVAWAPGVDLDAFSGVEVVGLSGPDPEAANVVRLADRRILVAAAHPATANLLEQRGFQAVVVDVSEFAKADGGLTCLSIRLRDPTSARGSASPADHPKVNT
jgi:dimethylargininase